jgi:hypothetical protein
MVAVTFIVLLIVFGCLTLVLAGTVQKVSNLILNIEERKR